MPKSRTRSWRSYDPARAQPAVCVPPLRRRAAGAAPPVRILGLDPGSRRTGWGVIELRGGQCRHLAHGCIRAAHEPWPQRLRLIFEALAALVGVHAPDEVAIERVFVQRNVDSALKLGHARGAALCALPPALPVAEYAARAVKLAVVGTGAAEKRQVAHMVAAMLGLPARGLPPDAADALAVALCHAHSRRLQELTGMVLADTVR